MKRIDSRDLSLSRHTDCDHIGRLLATRLSEGMNETVTHEVSERLKVVRLQAVERRRAVAQVKAAARANGLVHSGTSAALSGGDDDARWGRWWVAALPMLALVAGLLVINTVQSDNRDTELAEVDAALLTDDLPPQAYADPGFMQFLKSSRDSNR